MNAEKGELRKIFGTDPGFLRIAETHHRKPCEYPLHYHDAHEFLFILTGRGKLRVGPETFSLEAHDLVFLRRGVRHQILDGPEDLIHRYSLYFREDFLGRGNADQGFFKTLLALPPGEVLIPARENIFLAAHLLLFRELLFEFGRKIPDSALLQKAKLIEIAVAYERARKAKSEPHPPRLLPIEQKILLLMKDLEANYFRPQSLEDAAGRIPLGERQFSRLFKKVSGLPFVKYVNRLRIQAAQKILLEKGHIAGAAFETGFENLPYFYRVFKIETGKTPGDFVHSRKSNSAPHEMA
ncbi:MAG: helix-turn-helix domain-containing protein [Spirochaetia bacterium]|nr:helix-turn-helix domain-containing protein [Spirochaetia bacterium]